MKYAFTVIVFVLSLLYVSAQTTLEYNLKVGDVYAIEQNAYQKIILT